MILFLPIGTVGTESRFAYISHLSKYEIFHNDV